MKSDNLNFYEVDPAYVKYLQAAETAERGFSRIPNMEYSSDRKNKFLCGIVLQINGHSYFAPVTSYKLQKPDNFLIHSASGNVVASLRFNYMFPINLTDVKIKTINDITDEKYKSLVSQELRHCIQHQDTIRAMAARTYKRVVAGHNPGLVHNSCNFILLEKCCLEYAEKQASAEQTKSTVAVDAPVAKRTSLFDRMAAAEAEAARRNAERSKTQPPRGKTHERE